MFFCRSELNDRKVPRYFNDKDRYLVKENEGSAMKILVMNETVKSKIIADCLKKAGYDLVNGEGAFASFAYSNGTGVS